MAFGDKRLLGLELSRRGSHGAATLTAEFVASVSRALDSQTKCKQRNVRAFLQARL